MTFTLVGDGSSDKVLMPIVSWALRSHGCDPVISNWADLDRVPRPRDLRQRLLTAVDLYPCDLLFVHRDAEKQSPSRRRAEIGQAVENTGITHVPIIPVRMTEAWLLTNERAIRSAAGNPNGTDPIDLPPIGRIEDLSDPKTILHSALSKASAKNSRRRAVLPISRLVHFIPNYIEDYSPLKSLSAFAALQKDIEAVLAKL